MTAKTNPFKRAGVTDSDDFAAGQAAFLTLQALCRVEGLPPSRTVSTALVQTREWLAAIAQLRRVKAERDAL